MPTKLGFQLFEIHEARTAAALQRLREMRPAVLVVCDNPSLMNAVYDAVGPGPWYLFRQRALTDPLAYIQANGGVDLAAEKFLRSIEAAAKALPWAYHCTFQATTLNPTLAEFESLLIQRAQAAYGIRLCIGNFAPAAPEPPNWAVYRPALEAAAQHLALIGLREYYPLLPYVSYGPNANQPNRTATTPRKLINEIPYPQGYQQPAPLVGRYRYLRDYCRQQKLPLRIVITESGAGSVLPDWLNSFGPNLSGWNSLASLWQRWGFSDPTARYMQDLAWLDQHVYLNDPEVVGMGVYAWNMSGAAAYEIGDSAKLLDRLQTYLQDARRTQPLPYPEKAFPQPPEFRVITSRVRIRPLPSFNTKYSGGWEFGEKFTATHYTFHDGFLWVKHARGWSAYAPLAEGNPQYDEKLLEGPILTTPRQDAAVNNFVGTLTEVKKFLQAHQGQMFYIAINPGTTPEGARRFSITTFPVNQGRRLLDILHPEPGQPRMSPEARKQLRDANQL